MSEKSVTRLFMGWADGDNFNSVSKEPTVLDVKGQWVDTKGADGMMMHVEIETIGTLSFLYVSCEVSPDKVKASKVTMGSAAALVGGELQSSLYPLVYKIPMAGLSDGDILSAWFDFRSAFSRVVLRGDVADGLVRVQCEI